MSYLALYRRYRPNSFATVYGQKSQVTALQNAVARGMVHHSYVFAGPRGTGKTSVARILAKAVNCENPRDGDCCNECTACRLINAGTAIDVIEIDAASNNGVDEVRQLLEGVAYVPVALRKKVYIIDEAHMLTTSAWNALLKTLEEPPEYVIFIIATTEPTKVPLTILSRSQRHDFLRLSDKDLVSLLTKIANQEKLDVEERAIMRIAALSQGGARDAIGILDQLSLTTAKKITEAALIATFNLLETDKAVALAKSLLMADADSAIAILDGFYEAGKALAGVCNDLLSVLVEVSLYDVHALEHFAFINEKNGAELLVYKAQAAQMARRLAVFMTSLRSFEITRHHYRLLFVELSGGEQFVEQLVPVVRTALPAADKSATQKAPSAVKKAVSKREEATVSVSNNFDGLPDNYESAVEIFPIDLPAGESVPLEDSPKKEVAEKVPAPVLVPDLQTSKMPAEELILAIMYLNDPALKDQLQQRLSKLEDYFVEHPREASIYRDGRVLVACPKGLVIIFDQESKATLFNVDIKKFNHELFAGTLFSGNFRVVATDRAKARELGEKIKIMSKNNTVPAGVPALQGKAVSGNDSAFDFALDMFGEGIKVV